MATWLLLPGLSESALARESQHLLIIESKSLLSQWNSFIENFDPLVLNVSEILKCYDSVSRHIQISRDSFVSSNSRNTIRIILFRIALMLKFCDSNSNVVESCVRHVQKDKFLGIDSDESSSSQTDNKYIEECYSCLLSAFLALSKALENKLWTIDNEMVNFFGRLMKPFCDTLLHFKLSNNTLKKFFLTMIEPRALKSILVSLSVFLKNNSTTLNSQKTIGLEIVDVVREILFNEKHVSELASVSLADKKYSPSNTPLVTKNHSKSDSVKASQYYSLGLFEQLESALVLISCESECQLVSYGFEIIVEVFAAQSFLLTRSRVIGDISKENDSKMLNNTGFCRKYFDFSIRAKLTSGLSVSERKKFNTRLLIFSLAIVMSLLSKLEWDRDKLVQIKSASIIVCVDALLRSLSRQLSGSGSLTASPGIISQSLFHVRDTIVSVLNSIVVLNEAKINQEVIYNILKAFSRKDDEKKQISPLMLLRTSPVTLNSSLSCLHSLSMIEHSILIRDKSPDDQGNQSASTEEVDADTSLSKEEAQEEDNVSHDAELLEPLINDSMSNERSLTSSLAPIETGSFPRKTVELLCRTLVFKMLYFADTSDLESISQFYSEVELFSRLIQIFVDLRLIFPLVEVFFSSIYKDISSKVPLWWQDLCLYSLLMSQSSLLLECLKFTMSTSLESWEFSMKLWEYLCQNVDFSWSYCHLATLLVQSETHSIQNKGYKSLTLSNSASNVSTLIRTLREFVLSMSRSIETCEVSAALLPFFEVSTMTCWNSVITLGSVCANASVGAFCEDSSIFLSDYYSINDTLLGFLRLSFQNNSEDFSLSLLLSSIRYFMNFRVLESSFLGSSRDDSMKEGVALFERVASNLVPSKSDIEDSLVDRLFTIILRNMDVISSLSGLWNPLVKFFEYILSSDEVQVPSQLINDEYGSFRCVFLESHVKSLLLIELNVVSESNSISCKLIGLFRLLFSLKIVLRDSIEEDCNIIRLSLSVLYSLYVNKLIVGRNILEKELLGLLLKVASSFYSRSCFLLNFSVVNQGCSSLSSFTRDLQHDLFLDDCCRVQSVIDLFLTGAAQYNLDRNDIEVMIEHWIISASDGIWNDAVQPSAKRYLSKGDADESKLSDRISWYGYLLRNFLASLPKTDISSSSLWLFCVDKTLFALCNLIRLSEKRTYVDILAALKLSKNDLIPSDSCSVYTCACYWKILNECSNNEDLSSLPPLNKKRRKDSVCDKTQSSKLEADFRLFFTGVLGHALNCENNGTNVASLWSILGIVATLEMLFAHRLDVNASEAHIDESELLALFEVLLKSFNYCCSFILTAESLPNFQEFFDHLNRRFLSCFRIVISFIRRRKNSILTLEYVLQRLDTLFSLSISSLMLDTMNKVDDCEMSMLLFDKILGCWNFLLESLQCILTDSIGLCSWNLLNPLLFWVHSMGISLSQHVLHDQSHDFIQSLLAKYSLFVESMLLASQKFCSTQGQSKDLSCSSHVHRGIVNGSLEYLFTIMSDISNIIGKLMEGKNTCSSLVADTDMKLFNVLLIGSNLIMLQARLSSNLLQSSMVQFLMILRLFITRCDIHHREDIVFGTIYDNMLPKIVYNILKCQGNLRNSLSGISLLLLDVYSLRRSLLTEGLRFAFFAVLDKMTSKNREFVHNQTTLVGQLFLKEILVAYNNDYKFAGKA